MEQRIMNSTLAARWQQVDMLDKVNGLGARQRKWIGKCQLRNYGDSLPREGK